MQTAVKLYTICQNLTHAGYVLNYEESFYHSQRYLNSQAEKPQYSFFLCSPENDQVLGKIHFYRRDDQVISQVYAPFGSFNTAKVPRETAERFLSFTVESLSGQGFKQILIHHPASCYLNSTFWGEILIHHEFSPKCQVNHHLVIDNTPLKEKMHIMEQRKLSRCRQFEFRIHSVESLSKIYDFIYRCRKERKQSLSLSLEQLELVVRNSPDNFVICTVKSGDLLAAAAIVIKVNSKCWYQFYPAHSRRFDRESPLVFLISKLYEYAARHDVKVLDLGPSELHGQPLPGLLQFKSRLGAVITYKKYFSKSINS